RSRSLRQNGRISVVFRRRISYRGCLCRSATNVRCRLYRVNAMASPTGRIFYPELESLRGLAALSVVLFHIVQQIRPSLEAYIRRGRAETQRVIADAEAGDDFAVPVEWAQVGVFQSVAETPSDASENGKLAYRHAGFDALTLQNGGNGAKG